MRTLKQASAVHKTITGTYLEVQMIGGINMHKHPKENTVCYRVWASIIIDHNFTMLLIADTV